MGLVKRRTYFKPIFIYKKKIKSGFKYITISHFAEFAENIQYLFLNDFFKFFKPY